MSIQLVKKLFFRWLIAILKVNIKAGGCLTAAPSADHCRSIFVKIGQINATVGEIRQPFFAQHATPVAYTRIRYHTKGKGPRVFGLRKG